MIGIASVCWIAMTGILLVKKGDGSRIGKVILAGLIKDPDWKTSSCILPHVVLISGVVLLLCSGVCHATVLADWSVVDVSPVFVLCGW